MTRSDQPKPPAVAIVRQNGLSSTSCRASVAVTPVSRQIWWIQVVGGRPLACLHSCEGRSPSHHSKDLVCWYITSKSGDVTKQTQSSFADDVRDVERASTTQNLVVGHEVVPADVTLLRTVRSTIMLRVSLAPSIHCDVVCVDAAVVSEWPAAAVWYQHR